MALTPDTRATREAAQRVLAACRTADDDPPVPRDLSLARKNDGLEELLPLLGVGTTRTSSTTRRTFVLAVDDPDAVAAELVRAADVLDARLREGPQAPDASCPIRRASRATRIG